MQNVSIWRKWCHDENGVIDKECLRQGGGNNKELLRPLKKRPGKEASARQLASPELGREPKGGWRGVASDVVEPQKDRELRDPENIFRRAKNIKNAGKDETSFLFNF